MTRHPAKFTGSILEAIAARLDYLPFEDRRPLRFADPFAGTGKVLELEQLLDLRSRGVSWWLNELEPEWAALAEAALVAADVPGLVTCSDWLSPLLAAAGPVDVWITSPTYGNRMADHHTPSPADTSRRNTYRHALGRPLDPANSGQLQWGDPYRKFHEDAWGKLTKRSAPGALALVNVSDHIRKGEVVPVSAWHYLEFLRLGWSAVSEQKVLTPRNRQGANGAARVEHEWLYTFRLPT